MFSLVDFVSQFSQMAVTIYTLTQGSENTFFFFFFFFGHGRGRQKCPGRDQTGATAVTTSDP